MRWYVSYPVLAAGLVFGFNTFFPSETDLSPPTEAEIHSAVVTADTPAPDAAEPAASSRLADFAPGSHRLAAEPRARPRTLFDHLAQALSPTTPPPAVTAAPPVPVAAAPWKSVTIQDGATASPPATKPQPPEPISRVALARDIQRELKRVGCYSGAIDGIWGGGSKRAMVTFVDRVNAALPADEPDVVMLSLLRQQASDVCGSSCPRGQSPAESGRCVPTTLVAETVPDRRAAPYGRMGIGGPKPENEAQPPLERAAMLEISPDNERRTERRTDEDVAPSSFDTDAVQVQRARRVSTSVKERRRAAPRGQSAYRQVQHLFQHPLGQM